MMKAFVLLSALCCLQLAHGQPVVNPSDDQFIAFDSTDNVTFTCTVSSPRTVVWEVERSQIRSANQFSDTTNIGIFIEPMSTESSTSTIVVSQMARTQLNTSEISVVCLSVLGISSITGDTFRVVTFPSPNAPGNLRLVPAAPSLTLEWDRPTNVPDRVPITYQIEINSTGGSGMSFVNITTLTSLSVHFLEELLTTGQCVMFDFFVRASNDAGTSPLAGIVDTVPISPDVTNITRDLSVESVDLRPLQAVVSFPAVMPCSSTFPLRNYTIRVNGAIASQLLTPAELAPSLTDGLVRATVPESSLVLDSSFSLTVTACNDVTCKTSDPITLYTTDVQRAEAIFLEDGTENRLFLRCTFATNSQAQGCAIILTLAGTNETERLEVTRNGVSGTLCSNAANQREAYTTLEAFDLEANGNNGAVSLNVTPTVLSDAGEYVRLTGCREPTDNTAAIVGGVIGGILLLLIIALIVGGIIVGVTTGSWCGVMDSEELRDMLFKPKDSGDVEEGHEGHTHEKTSLLTEEPKKKEVKDLGITKIPDSGAEGEAHQDGAGSPKVAVKKTASKQRSQLSTQGSVSKKSKLERKKYVVMNTKHVKQLMQMQQ